MFGTQSYRRRVDSRTRSGSRQLSPSLEGLESRELMTATPLDGGQWTYGSRITYSFVPDGTSIGGVSSNLNSTLSTSVGSGWQTAFSKAAALWEAVTNINIALVSDNGAALGASGNQQGDSNVGDIRISMIPQSGGVLAFTMLPPPINGGTDAGDIVFNSNVTFGSAGYDLTTVAIHEFGHALGLDHSSVVNDVMYAYYNGTNQTVSSDDGAGLVSLYGNPLSGSSNPTAATATPVTLNSNGTATVSNVALDGAANVNWYSFTAPSNTNGTMTVTMQTSKLSSASPRFVIYASNGTTGLAQATAPNVYGTSISTSISVTAGTKYYVKALPASVIGSYGAYGLLVSFTSSTPTAITPPNTTVASQADVGGGSINDSTSANQLILNQVVTNLQNAVNLIQTTGQVPFSTILNALPNFLQLGYVLSQAGPSAAQLTTLATNVATAFISGNVSSELAAAQAFLANVVQAGSITAFGDYYTVQPAGNVVTEPSLAKSTQQETPKELALFRAEAHVIERRVERAFAERSHRQNGNHSQSVPQTRSSSALNTTTTGKSDSNGFAVILAKADEQGTTSTSASFSRKAIRRNS